MTLRIVLYAVAAALIGAHFLRAGHTVVAVVCVAAPLLFCVRRRWSLVLLQGLAYAAAATWLVTAWQVAAMRQSFGEPWVRATVILVCVAAFTALAGTLLRTGRARARLPASTQR